MDVDEQNKDAVNWLLTRGFPHGDLWEIHLMCVQQTGKIETESGTSHMSDVHSKTQFLYMNLLHEDDFDEKYVKNSQSTSSLSNLAAECEVGADR